MVASERREPLLPANSPPSGSLEQGEGPVAAAGAVRSVTIGDGPNKRARRKGHTRHSWDGVKWLRVVQLVLTVHILSFAFGYDIGVTSCVLLWIDDKGEDGVGGAFKLLSDSTALRGLIVSLVSFGAVIGAHVTGRTETGLGARGDLQLGALLLFMGALLEGLMATANWYYASTLIVFAMFRLIAGAGMGIVLHFIPTYVGELAPPSIRGMLNSMEEVAIVVGLLVGYVGGLALNHPALAYFGMAVTSLIGLVGLKYLPQAPSSLILKAEASRVLHPTRQQQQPQGQSAPSSPYGASSGGFRGSVVPTDRVTESNRRIMKALSFLNASATWDDVRALEKDLKDALYFDEELGDGTSTNTPSSGSSSRSSREGSSENGGENGSNSSNSSNGGTEDETAPDKGEEEEEGFLHPQNTPSFPRTSDTTSGERGEAEDQQGGGGGGGGGGKGDSSSCIGSSISSSSSSSSSHMGNNPPHGRHTNLWQIKSVRMSLYVSTGVVVVSVLSGMLALLYYAALLFSDIGIISVNTGLALLGTLKLLVTFIVAFTIDRFGRKTLLLLGMTGMTCGMGVMGIACLFGSMQNTETVAWAVMAGFYLVVASYELGPGPVTWVLMGEIFPPKYRQQAAAQAITLLFAVNGAVTLLLPLAKSALGWGGLFVLFAVVSLGGVFFVKAFVVETAQLSLTDIQRAMLRQPSFRLLHLTS